MKNSSKLRNFVPFVFLSIIVLIFFWQFLLSGKVPAPLDTIVGMYNPFRDEVWSGFTHGVPFKNFLITDPVRQQIPWKLLSISLIKGGEFPLWNPYGFSGTPLLANLQSAVFYPFNLLFFIFPFWLGWGILIVLQPLLGMLFLYLFLKEIGVGRGGAILGSIVWGFCGFSIAWISWGTMLHVALWLPLILLSAEKIFKRRNLVFWSSIFVAGIVFQFFAGHLQISFYLVSLVLIYILAIFFRSVSKSRAKVLFFVYVLFGVALVISSVQLLPFFDYVGESARVFDQAINFRTDWYLPWQNLVQFVAPDFFGNPATLNYWGAWNYGEFVGYIGILPLIFAFFAIFARRDKKTLFWSLVFAVSLILALPNPISFIPYKIGIPFISTSAPSRILILVDFSLAIVAALGFDFWFRQKKNLKVFLPFSTVFLVLIILFAGIRLQFGVLKDTQVLANLLISQRNLIFPLVLVLFSGFVLLLPFFIKNKKIVFLLVMGIVVFDLFRFGWKFISFSKSSWFYPSTSVISRLSEKDEGYFRIMSVDRRIMPANFSTAYRISDVSGYDPLYLLRYGQFIAAVQRGKPDISPFSFNRIVTVEDINSKFINLLNVRYVLTLADINLPRYEKVLQEGQTRIYKNTESLPRVFLVSKAVGVSDREEAIRKLFENSFDYSKEAVVEGDIQNFDSGSLSGSAEISGYGANTVKVSTRSEKESFLVLLDPFEKNWNVYVNGKKAQLYATDFAFRGVFIPKGESVVEFKYEPISFKTGAILSVSGIGLLLGICLFVRRKRGV